MYIIILGGTTLTTKAVNKQTTYDLVYISIFAVLITICSWISIPTAIPFTLQTFAIFLSVAILGGKRGTLAILVYILLGTVGIPVFAGFTGGISILFGTTGGYILGFFGSSLIMWGIEKIFGKKTYVLAISMLLGLIVCYVFGTAWFLMIYSRTNGIIEIGTVLGWCVVPFIIPDLFKIILALFLHKRLSKIIFN